MGYDIASQRRDVFSVSKDRCVANEKSKKMSPKEQRSKELEKIAKKIVKDYGDVLRRLAKE